VSGELLGAQWRSEKSNAIRSPDGRRERLEGIPELRCRSHAPLHDREEKTINRLGYAFLQEKDLSSAVVLFKLNTKAYPDSANAWDSLEDGYEATNDVQDARMAYARSVELNPNNEHAKGELVKLRK
jgi:tetratricopeptide (TPR) repeat protein